ncbi:FAD/NAD(P)-binding domain-containing protein [Imleria badia]|nr:FAD/NAD(P)-binding domain-containing protein [Imleria badia]
MRLIIGLVLLAGVSAAGVQEPLTASSSREAEPDEYQFDWPIQRVAVIGAGPSGLVAYRELTEAGFDVRIFERDSVPGGNWHYTEEVPPDAPVPNTPTALADFVPSLPPAGVDLPYSEVFEDEDGEARRDHRGPKPIWESLTLNAPSPAQQFPQWHWPPGTKWELPQYQVRNYVRSYASYLNVNSNDDNPATAYNTRVERIEKRINGDGQEQGWRLWLKSLAPTGRHTHRATWWTEDFDAIAVAVGKFYAPSIPSIPGLDEWVRRFPGLIRHSRQYRRPEAYGNQTVLIVGASVSGSEISRDLNRHAGKIFQSFRPDTDRRWHYRLENYVRRIPKNTTLVGEIKQFLPIPEGSPIQAGLVELKNGTVLSGIDSVILATGFRYSFPFLPQYYDDATYVPHEGSAKTVSPFIPLDGSHLRDLYLDTFYIQDPTLAFIGMTEGTQFFVFSDYTTLAVAKVWSNTAKLPNSQTMRALHDKTVEERGGYGKRVMFLGPERSSAISRYLVGWLNEAAAKYGGKQIDGFPKDFGENMRYFAIALYGGPLQETIPEGDDTVLATLGLGGLSGADQGRSEYDPIYDDVW